MTISRGLLVVLGVGFLAVVFVGIVLGSEAVWQLLLGWVLFLVRVVGQIHPDRNTVIVGIAAVLLFAGGVYVIGRDRLGFRGSVAVTALMFVLFASAVAMVGVVHQTGWIATSPEPLRYK